MMDTKLKNVKIHGFRSIKDVSLDLGDVNILIGPNGSGKSNFISALYFLQNVLDKKLQYVVGTSGLNYLLYGGQRNTDEIRMEFTFEDNSYGFELVPNNSGNLVFKREFYGRGSARSDIQRTPFGFESEFEKGVGNGADSCAEPVLEEQRWRVYHFHDTTPRSSMKQAGMLSDTVSLHHDASNLAPFLYVLKRYRPDSYNGIVRVVKMVTPFFDDFLLEPNLENREIISLRWKQVGSEMVFGPNEFSDGTIRFICLATLLLQPSELQPTTIILDEPELGLHPYAVSILAELIHMVSPRKQVIISTQSAELIDCFDADDVIVTELKDNGSEYTRLSSENLKGWLEDYSLSTVWKKNVFGGRP